MRSLAWCIVLAACGMDVRLGTAPDAPVDAPLDGHPDNPFASGSYALTFVDPAQVMCEGDLAGMEASFESITRAMLSFVDGTVTLDTSAAEALIVSGAPITTAYGDALTLTPEPNPPPDEPVLWGASAATSGVGPLATTNTQRILVLDSSTATAAQIDAAGGAQFDNAAGTGFCMVLFVASLTPQ